MDGRNEGGWNMATPTVAAGLKLEVEDLRERILVLERQIHHLFRVAPPRPSTLRAGIRPRNA
jgi:hypothetical protein